MSLVVKLCYISYHSLSLSVSRPRSMPSTAPITVHVRDNTLICGWKSFDRSFSNFTVYNLNILFSNRLFRFRWIYVGTFYESVDLLRTWFSTTRHYRRMLWHYALLRFHNTLFDGSHVMFFGTALPGMPPRGHMLAVTIYILSREEYSRILWQNGSFFGKCPRNRPIMSSYAWR